ncbi:hypothetical protein CBS101457_005223 [Exobasidium rhododendri]|nr:hypothetical protein CBS101457_005223 [Exobasidium rhododendri]
MLQMKTDLALSLAIGAPLVYADQARNIVNRRNAEGFSKDVCAVLLIANICRCFFWLGERFELALLLQSVLMIIAQIFLLSLLVKYRPGSFASSTYSISSGDQPSSSANTAKPADPTDASSRPGPQPSHQFAFDVEPPTPIDGEDAAPNPWKNASLGPAKRGLSGYTPLLDNLNLPPPPILGYQEGEEEEAEGIEQSRGQRLRRFGSKSLRFLTAGLRTGSKNRLDGSSGSRPFGFWTWHSMSSYLIFLALLVLFLGILQLLVGYFQTYVSLLGFFALGLESTLPIPQAIANQQRRSLSGFRLSVLIGWLGGDLFKTFYFLFQKSPLQFTICALFQLSIDFVIAAQMHFFREKTRQDEEEQRLAEVEALEAGQGRGLRSNTAEEASLEDVSSGPLRGASAAASSHFRIDADDDDEEDDIK